MTSQFPTVAFLTRMLVLAGVITLVSPDVQSEGGEGKELKAQRIRAAPVQFFAVPGYWMLHQESVRRDLEIVPEQQEKLQQIAKDYQQQIQELYVPVRNKDLTQEERMKLYRELSEKSRKLQEEAKQKVEQVLLPHQLDALEMGQLRTRANSFLRSPHMLDRLGLSEQQREKVRKNRAELEEETLKLQKKAFEKILEILTPEQLEKLKQPGAGGMGRYSWPVKVQAK